MKLTSLSTNELRKELAKREKQIPLLTAKKAKLIKRIEKIDALIGEMEGQARKPYTKKTGKRKYVKKAVKEVKKFKSLNEVLVQVLAGKGSAKVADIAKMALKAGYRSQSPQFQTIVSQTLSKDKKRFEKVGYGVYRLRDGGIKAKPAKTSVAKPVEKPAQKSGKIKTLPDVLFDIMKGKKAVKVGEAARLAQEAGYQSKSGLFVMTVGKALKGDKRFKKVGSGLFQVK